MVLLPIVDLLVKIANGVHESLLSSAGQILKDEGISQTSHLIELHWKEFDALRLPLLLKSRLRRIWESGKVPVEFLSCKEAGQTTRQQEYDHSNRDNQ